MNSEQKELIKCKKCSLDIINNEYKECFVCENFKHDVCLSLIELKSYKEESKKILCDECMYEIANQSLNEKIKVKNPKKNDENNSESESSDDSDSDESENSDESSDDDPEETETGNKRNVTMRKRKKSRRSSCNDTGDIAAYFQKLSLKKLPKVTDNDVSWTIFFEAYKDTKDFFTDRENVIRIEEAIKDERVKNIGGKALFNPKTYDECLCNINKRLKNNFNVLYKEANDIENHASIKNHQKSKAIEFIDKLRNFDTLAKAYNEMSYTHNKKFLANVANVLPTFLKNAWEKKQAKLEGKNKSVTLRKLIDVLDKFIPTLELSIRNEAFASNKKEKDEKDKKKHDKGRVYSTNIDTNPTKNSKSSYKCWYHKNDSHSFYQCKDLWKMDGKAVTEIAKKNGICTYCGLEWSSHKSCPNNKIKCKVEGCEHPHISLFCFKRKVNNAYENRQPFHNNNHKDDSRSSRKDENLSKSNQNSDDSESNSEDEVEKIYKEISNCNFYTNKNSIPAHSSKNTKYSKPWSNINVIDNSSNCLINNKFISSVCTLGVVVVKLNGQRNVPFLVDTGSSVSLIEESVANELNLRGPWFPLTLRWSGDQKRTDKYSRIIKTDVCGLNSNKSYSMCFRTVRNLKMCSQKFNANEFYAEFPHLMSMNLYDYEDIGGIIGIDNVFVFEHLQTFKPHGKIYNAPLGIRCPLGDYLLGSLYPLENIYNDLNKDNDVCNSHVNVMSHCYELTEAELNELKIMEDEVMGYDYSKPMEGNDRNIAEDEYALEKLKMNTKKMPKSDHYIAPLLWKNDDICLNTKESFKVSLRRFMIIEKQSYKTGKFEECAAQIDNLLRKGYARELNASEINTISPKTYYNPIFFISPHSKRTRMIWDLAAKVNGKSLNDYLIAGPNLYNNLLEMIIQMRERAYLFKGDLSEMFHQIYLCDDDTDSLRFLFRFSQDEKIRVFKMLVLPFGAKCSPTVSQYVKNLVAHTYRDTLQQPCDTILYNSYVDDIVKSVDTLTDAKTLPIQIKRILHTGGFNLLKINSNSKEVISHIKSHLNNDELKDDKLFSQESNEKLLGYDINFRDDTFSVNFCLDKFPREIISGVERPTRRQFLQILMSLFDPLGVVQFLTSKLKIIYHRLCKEKYEWEQLLSDELNTLWLKCLDWLKQINELHIPRLYCQHYNNADEIQLWAFGDSGKEIACGVLFLRFLKENQQIGYNLLYAKSFVTPLKQNRTIPELELNISSKICEMVNEVKKMLTLPISKTYYVTDNVAVKEWTYNPPSKPTIYVKNRLDKIRKLTDKNEWIWLPTDLMVADFGTKFNSMPQIKFENDWFQPRLFCLPEENWPSFQANKDYEIQLNMYHASLSNDDNEDLNDDPFDPSKYKNYLSLVSVAQIAYKWLNLAKNSKIKLKITELRLKLIDDKHNREIKDQIKLLNNQFNERKSKIMSKSFMFQHVENILYKKAQNDVFSNEIKVLNSEKPLKISNKLFKLCPLIDENGIIRVSTRIGVNKNNIESFGYDRICPILLPKNHPLTTLIILHYHVISKHALKNSVVVNLMKRYHIPHIKWIVNQTIKNKCFTCRRYNTRPQIPQMGDLPAVRLAHHVPAFTYAIVDLAGPVTVNVHRNITDKRYIFVYSCLTTRAVHLELMQHMDSDSTLIALANTINLRGAPIQITSDNGLNFKGAINMLNDADKKWNKKLMERGIITTPIKWKFGPPRSPHSQGSVERMVGLTKMILKKINDIVDRRKKLYNDYMLNAILREICAVINNRPLSLIPIDGTNTEILTPNYFLIGRQNTQILTSNTSLKKNLSIKQSYEDLKLITNILWNHWIKAYLPTILLKEKWIEKKTPLKVGDLVITVDTVVANSWRIGKVLEVIIGSNNQAREYKILLGKNNGIPEFKNLNRKKLLEIYKKENYSIVNRGAVAVAKIDVEAIKI